MLAQTMSRSVPTSPVSTASGPNTEKGRRASFASLTVRASRLSGGARPLLGVCLTETSTDDRHARPCLVDRDAVVQSTDYAVATGVPLFLAGVTEPYRLLEGRGQPDVDAEEVSRDGQLGRRHPHDGEG